MIIKKLTITITKMILITRISLILSTHTILFVATKFGMMQPDGKEKILGVECPTHWASPGNFLCLLCTFIICHRGTEVSMKSAKVGEFLWGEEFLGFSHPTLQGRPQPSDRSLLHSTGSLLSVIS